MAWSKRVDESARTRQKDQFAARDDFVAAHETLGIAIGSDTPKLMVEVQNLCVVRAWKVDAVMRRHGELHPSPLSVWPFCDAHEAV